MPNLLPVSALSLPLTHSTFTAPHDTSPPCSPRTAVLHDRNLVRRISDYVATPSARALCADMDERRTRAKLQRVSKCFAQVNAEHANRQVEELYENTLQGHPQISEFTLRLARNRLSVRYPHPAIYAALSRTTNVAGRFLLNAVYDMGPALAPEPPWPTDVGHDEEDAAQRAWISLFAQYAHDFFSYLSRGDYSVPALTTLAKHYADLAKQDVSVWHDNLALDAARAGSWDNVRLLLENGLAAPDSVNTTYASDLDTIERECTDEDLPTVPLDEHLHTPTGLLHLAAGANNLPALTCVHAYLEAHGISIDYTDGAGANALAHAVRSGHASACEWLLEHGADATLADADGNTALHHACSAQIAALLIQAEADVNASNQAKESPLHGKNDPAVVRLLLAAGANVDAQDKACNPPLFYVHNPETIELLCAHGANLELVNRTGSSVLHHWLRHQIDPEDYLDAILGIHAGCRTPAQIDGLRTLLELRDHRGRIPLHNYLRAQGHALSWSVCISSANFQPLRHSIRLTEYFRNMGAALDARDHHGRSVHDYVLELQTSGWDWQQNLGRMPHESRRARARVLNHYATWQTLVDRLETLLRPVSGG